MIAKVDHFDVDIATLLGLFRNGVQPRAEQAKTSALADQLMDLILVLRAEARKKKDFATADAIREGLTKLGITVEDRPGGTIWRKE